MTDSLREAIGLCAAAVFYSTAGIYLIVILIRNGWFSRRRADLTAAAQKVKAAAKRLTAKKASRTTVNPAVHFPQQKPSMLPNVVFVAAVTRSLLIQNTIFCSYCIGWYYDKLFPLHDIPAPILLIALIYISVVTAGMSAFFYDKANGTILFNSIMFFSTLVVDLSGWYGLFYALYLIFLSPAVTVAAMIFTILQIVFYKWIIRKWNCRL